MKNTPTKMSLAWLLFAAFATMTVLVVSIIGSFLFYRDYRRFQLEADHLRRDHIERQQQRVKNEVDRIIQFIQHSRAKTQERLKASIKDRTYEAHAIATHLYRNHHGTMDGQGVRRIIIEALRPIRFNNGRGYYFATGLDGVEILFADRPEMEGKLLLDLQDTRGAFVIRDMIDLVERHGEGFYNYIWTRPDVLGQDFPKIAFVKHFAPFNGFLGTGEYLDDVEQDIQQEVLETIGKIRFDQDGYLFVVGYDGVTLMNGVQPELIGKNLWDMTDPNGVKVIQEERRAAEKPGGDFIHYHWENPSTRQVRPKVSFVRGFPEWRWMVGAGFYSDEVESVIAARQSELWRQMRRDSLTLCLILIGILLGAVFFSYFLARTFKRQMEHFLAFFRDMETGGTRIAVEQLRLRELEALAGLANSMLAKRLQTDRELRDSEDRYRQLFEAESDAILLIDNETGRILEANHAASAMYGYSRQELVALKNTDLSAEPEDTRRVTRETVLVSEFVVTVPLRYHRRKDGTGFPVEITGRFFSWQERPVHIAAIRDISERKRAEEERLELDRQLQQAQKAESLGRMAGAIAHHFNNLLGAVLGNLELALLEMPQGQGPRENIAEAMTASRRAAEISRLMLAYLGQRTGERKALDLSELCRDSLPVFIASLPKNIRLKSELPDPGPIIRGDAVQVKQLLANLVANAEEAIGDEEGDITVAVSLVAADNVHIPGTHFREWEPTEEAYACIEVSDTGCGMDLETLERIFDPFFSTKFTGRGLGLSVALGTVKAHDGAVAVESEPGRGAVFRIYLLLSAEQPRPSPEAEAVATEPPGEGGLVLLVEDEPAMRKMAQTMLKRLGWEVVTACDGIEAVEVFRQHQDRVQCLLLDLSMPRMGGWETLAAVRAIRPDIPVVLASGYDEAQVMAGDHPERPQAFLSKPYQMAQLEAALSRMAAAHVSGTRDAENADDPTGREST